MDASPGLGLAGVKQITPDGRLFPTIRRFPNALRALFEAMGSERYPLRASWLGERELDLSRYEREFDCDWTSGSFMLARREALESAGYFDERFFIYSEETDLCLRIKAAGWDIRHLPIMTVLHHADKAGVNPKMAAQDAYARKQYSRKHFSPDIAVHTSAHSPSATASVRLLPDGIARSRQGDVPKRAQLLPCCSGSQAAFRITPEGRRSAESSSVVRRLEARDQAANPNRRAPPPPASSGRRGERPTSVRAIRYGAALARTKRRRHPTRPVICLSELTISTR